MPHVPSGGGDDLGSTDEVKVFKDEGVGEDEKSSSEVLREDKSSLIDLTESEVLTTYSLTLLLLQINITTNNIILAFLSHLIACPFVRSKFVFLLGFVWVVFY